MMASCGSSLIRLSLFAMLALSAYSGKYQQAVHEMVNQPKCFLQEDSYSWARARDCSSCANKLATNCWWLNKEARNIDCIPRGYSVICDCCCTPTTPPPPPPSPPPPSPPPPSPPPPSPPPPSPPPPSPPPPSPPPPTPTKDTCDKPGDMYSEITNPTSDCTWCKDWCENDCAEQEGDMVSNKCSMGESKFVTRCKCCCHEKPKPSPPPPPPPTPTGDTCDKPGDMYSEITNPTSDCTWCKDWCENDCSEQDGEMVSNKCSIGESKFVTRCKCCCHEKSKPSPPPPPPSTRDTCVKPGDKYSETVYATSNCNDCDDWCKTNCLKQGAEVVTQTCSIPGQSQFLRRCECCCNNNPKPSPSPPPPPAPTRDTCEAPGDIYTETTFTSSDCSFCKNWCKDDCSELGGQVVSNKCSMGESKFATRCKCCCNESSVLQVKAVKENVGLKAH